MKKVRTPLSILWVLPLLLVLVSPLRGQTGTTAGETSPEAVAGRAVLALKEGRIADFASDMHPEALRDLKSTLLEVVDAAEDEGRVEEVLSIFRSVDSAGELRQLDDLAFFTAFFEGVMQSQPRLRDALRGMELEVIGNVPEGSDVTHVVYRGTMTLGELKMSKMSVMSLKADGEGWGMLLSGDIEGVAAMLKRQYGVQD